MSHVSPPNKCCEQLWITGEDTEQRENAKEIMRVSLIMFSSMALMLSTCQANSNLHPLILVPGNGGNQLEARLTSEYKTTTPWCSRWNPIHKDKDGWFRLWFDLSVLLAPFTTCFAHRMTLYYDRDLDDYRNAPGVETRVCAFGSTQSLLYLDPNLQHVTAYMAPLVESLEQIGYVNGQNLFGAPYDFRYGLATKGHPCKVGSKFLSDLKHLIEKASASNGGKPVIIISHSLGGLFVHQLLSRNPLSWRQNFIKHFVALATPWGGTVQEMLTFASGYTLGVPLVEPLLVRDEQRSSESNLWLMPSPLVFNKQRLLVITPNASYSAHEIEKFLTDIGFSQGVDPYKTRILPLMKGLSPPQVRVTCIIGKGVRTVETLFYDKRGFDEQPNVVYGDGDGTVNLESLMAPQFLWADDEKNQSLKFIELSGISHTSILNSEFAITKIVQEISDINSLVTESVYM